jgi:hypothetical protein
MVIPCIYLVFNRGTRVKKVEIFQVDIPGVSAGGRGPGRAYRDRRDL